MARGLKDRSSRCKVQPRLYLAPRHADPLLLVLFDEADPFEDLDVVVDVLVAPLEHFRQGVDTHDTMPVQGDKEIEAPRSNVLQQRFEVSEIDPLDRLLRNEAGIYPWPVSSASCMDSSHSFTPIFMSLFMVIPPPLP